MCISAAAMLALSAAATAGGTALQMKSQGDAQKKIENALRTTGEANEKLRRESQARVLESSDKFSREIFDQTQADETAKLDTKFTTPLLEGALPGEFYGGQQSENTQRFLADKNQEATDYSTGLASALANLRGFGQGLGVNTRDTRRAGELVQLNQGAQAGNSAVLPIQMDAAARSGANPLADIMVQGGNLGLNYGLGFENMGNVAAPGGVPVPGIKPPVPTGFKLS